MAADGRLGPLVHRAVHHGATLWVLAALQFIAVMVALQLAWTHAPGYSLSKNFISDLGNTGCGPWPHASSRFICSPLPDAFNASSIAFGVLLLLGALLVPTAFPPRRSRTVGLALLVLAGFGAIGVGLSPENVDLPVHLLSAGVAFGAGNLALIVLALGMFRDTRWDGYRAYTLLSGLVGLIALVLLETGHYAGLGPGGMERLVAAPAILWLLVAGVHLLRVPTFAPTGIPKSPAG
jgi:hypothetical membrane protein